MLRPGDDDRELQKGERLVEDPWAAAHAGKDITPLVGREHELNLLGTRWEQVRSGEGQVASIVGQPGIGKSRLIQALREIAQAQDCTLMRYYCTPYYQTTTLYPMVAQLERAADFAREDSPERKADKLRALLGEAHVEPPVRTVLFGGLMALPVEARFGTLNLSPQQQREQTYEAFEQHLYNLASEKPVLAVFEDFQWADPTTVELLERIVDRLYAHAVLLIVTYRPEVQPPWVDEPNVTTITLNRLNQISGTAIVQKVLRGKALPDEVLEQIIRKADGIPLFVEEVTKTVLESGFLREEDDAYVIDGPLPPMAVPSTLHDSLMARLDRLAPVRDVAQLGAVLGRQFTFPLLSAVVRIGERELSNALDRLVEAELIYVRGSGDNATYTFKHALVRDAAYGSMLRSRRRYMHGLVANALERQFSEQVANEPQVLAHHLAEAGEAKRAIHFLQEAGRQASRRSANQEAASHLTRGLELLCQLEDTAEHAEKELELQIALGTSLTAGRNYAAPEVEEAFLRAEALAVRLGDRQRQFVTLRGLWNCYYVQAKFDKAEAQCHKLLALAESEGQPNYEVIGRQALGQTLTHAGRFESALAAFHRGIELAESHPDAGYGRDAPVYCYAYGALAKWCTGERQEAIEWSDKALRQSQALERPFLQTQILGFAALLYLLMKDVGQSKVYAGSTIEIAEEYIFPYWSDLARVVQGWALCVEGNHAQGIAQMEAGMEGHHSFGALAVRTWFLALLAEVRAAHGEIEVALGLLNQGIKLVADTGENLWASELWRLKGVFEAQLSQDDKSPGLRAEGSLTKALNIARSQNARAWIVRTSNSVCRFLSEQGRQEEARTLLARTLAEVSEDDGDTDLADSMALKRQLN